MGLIDEASSDCRVVDVGLSVVYAKRRVYGSWARVQANVTTVYNQAWEYTRSASKHYRYTGLTESAAKAKAKELRAYYTRSVEVSEWDADAGDFRDVAGGSLPMADVAASHVAGRMWEVTASVNETDTKLRLGSWAAEALFVSERSRGYDGETEA